MIRRHTTPRSRIPRTSEPRHRRTGSRRPRPARLVARITALALILGSCLSILPGLPGARTAAAEAAVIGSMVSVGGWLVGAFVSSTGDVVYCIEPGAAEPRGAQQGGRTVSSLPGYSHAFSDQTGWTGSVSSGPLSGEKLRQINYVLSRYGDTTDLASAVAVQIAVWVLRDDPGARAWLDHHLDWMRRKGGGGHVDSAMRIVQEALEQAIAAPRPVPEPLRIERDAPDPDEHGEYGGTVHYPAGTTELHIAGGVFESGGSRLAIEGGRAGSARWRAAPHADGWRGRHEVSVTGSWRIERVGWPAEVRLFSPETAGQQRLVGGVAQAAVVFTGPLSATDVAELQFAPVLTTEVPERFLGAGERFADTVTLASAAGTRDWPSRLGRQGVVEFAPIAAEGTVYGPFEAPQAPDDEVPPGAPVAARARLVADAGPGEYAVESEDAVPGAGYYYWVWSIDAAGQPTEAADGALLPSGYRYADRFGLVEEGQVVPSRLRWSTSLAENELHPVRAVLRDRITVHAEDGRWLRDVEGDPIPARIRLTVYRTPERPVRGPDAPEGAEEVARGFVDLSAPDTTVEAAAIQLPAGTTGWVTVQACLWHEDQPDAWRGYAEEWCDDYGVPEETARIATIDSLTETGAREAPRLAAVPVLAGGLIYAGVNALVAGVLLGHTRRRRRGAPGEPSDRGARA